MDENKERFIKALSNALVMYSRTGVSRLEYMKRNGFEYVKIKFADGSTKAVDITADSCIAIMNDVWRALV
jgi:hypothetical protein